MPSVPKRDFNNYRSNTSLIDFTVGLVIDFRNTFPSSSGVSRSLGTSCELSSLVDSHTTFKSSGFNLSRILGGPETMIVIGEPEPLGTPEKVQIGRAHV